MLTSQDPFTGVLEPADYKPYVPAARLVSLDGDANRARRIEGRKITAKRARVST